MTQQGDYFISRVKAGVRVLRDAGSELKIPGVLAKLGPQWPVELRFKLGKQQGQIDEWRSQNPWRILCEVYAKLVAMIIQHWVLLVRCWADPDRSLVKGTQRVRSYGLLLALALGGSIKLTTVLQLLPRTVAAGCRMNPRKPKPNTCQLWLNPAYAA